MAATEVTSVNMNRPEIKIHKFENGSKIAIVQQEGNGDRTQALCNKGAAKTSLLFRLDKDGDCALTELLKFCMEGLKDKPNELEDIKRGVSKFISDISKL